jgi:Na+/proline symporter
VLNLPEIGGMAGLTSKLPEWTLRFTPVIGEAAGSVDLGGAFALSIAAFLAFVGVQWWASWYPGAEPGGGGYIAQRMMSAKDEKHSLFATLWFTVAHYCIRPWPWIIVGLTTLVLYPELDAADRKLGYVYAMRDFLPIGLKGMLIAAFFAAYMSTIATQLNWGSSYVINDFYRRFLNRSAQERHLVLVSRITTILIMLISLVVTSILETISDAWAFIIEAGAGLGLVLILRWFWWRINAWSEIAAMVAPLAAYGVLKLTTDIQFPETLYFIVLTTTVVWIAVTFFTRPTDRETLVSFYRRVHPGGAGWKEIAALVPEIRPDRGFGLSLVNWIAGVVLVYAALFGFGNLILGDTSAGLLLLGAGALAGGFIYWNLSRAGFETIVE